MREGFEVHLCIENQICQEKGVSTVELGTDGRDLEYQGELLSDLNVGS